MTPRPDILTNNWAPTSVTESLGGRFQIVFSLPGGVWKDVTFFRGAPTRIDSYSSADPFGDSTLQVTFPQLSAWDDLTGADVGSWLKEFANVDLYWIPMTQEPIGQGLGDTISPLNQFYDAHTNGGSNKVKLWEGYVASIDMSDDESGTSIFCQCQGALFQADRYLAKPFYPPRPYPYEKLIAEVFDHTYKPHLRTRPLQVEWPSGWTKTIPSVATPTLYTPVGKAGDKYTGYASRQTGGWDHSLTNYVADLLAVMYTDETCGATPGNQWTLRKDTGRIPVLHVRDRFRTPDVSVWVGTPGVTTRLTRDTTQMSNVIYGSGTGLDGTVWRNAEISNDGSRTDYLPLAAAPQIYPPVKNPNFDPTTFASETYYQYGNGFDQPSAVSSAKKSLNRDADPGWAGEVTLRIDPPEMTRYQIRAGMVLRLQGFSGTGANGLALHIASVEVDVQEQRVTLKVDTRFRDLLNLEQALARTRDPLTPSKLLQINKRSVMIEDIVAPWDYTAGSGFIPKNSVKFHANRPATTGFPWTSWTTAYPPRSHGAYYVKVKANAAKRDDRWTMGVPILMSQKGSITRTEIACFDINGNLVKIPFHVNLTYFWEQTSDMPSDPSGANGVGPSPFIPGAFEQIQTNGLPWAPGDFRPGPPDLIIGWGNKDQPAGYSPGRKSDGYAATGLLIDDAVWSFDLASQHVDNFSGNNPTGYKVQESAITIFANFYAEHTEPVYFMGRLYKQPQGT